MNLLLIEDNQQIAEVIFDFFELKNYELDYANNGLQGYQLASENYYDLIILDIMLPKMDGFTLCQKLREEGNTTPILMLTARDQRDDILQGFNLGSDDYLVKPFDLEILDARVQALTRRSNGEISPKVFTFEDLSLNVSEHIVTREGAEFKLNPTLFLILKTLMQEAPNIVSREMMIQKIWPDNQDESHTLRSHIYQLRTLIDKPFKTHYIKTIPKVGFQLVNGEDKQ